MKKTEKVTVQKKIIISADNLVSTFQNVINGIKGEITDDSDESHRFSVKERVAFVIVTAGCFAKICRLNTDKDYFNGIEDEEISVDASKWKGVLQDEVKWLLDDESKAFKIYKDGFIIDTPPSCKSMTITTQPFDNISFTVQ